MLLRIAVVVSFLVVAIQGHGYLFNPPARTTAWRVGFKTPSYTDDMSLYCGGRGVQHSAKNQGRCSVCGEEYSNPVKKFEPGPGNKYATGTIVANYKQGETIDVTVMLTAYHKGYFQFKLCENNIPQKGTDASIAVTTECLDRNLLTSPTGETKFPASSGKSTHKVKLPEEVRCSACVFQWRYRAGNNWGCEDGDCGLGKGGQEEFAGCADIAIQRATESEEIATIRPPNLITDAPETTSAPTTQPPTTQPPTTQPPTTQPPTTQPPTTQPPTTQPPTTDPPKTDPPKTDTPKTDPPKTDSPATQPPTTQPTKTEEPKQERPETRAPPTTAEPATTPARKSTIKTIIKVPDPSSGRNCRGRGRYAYMYHSYCRNNCNHKPPHCPPSHCTCD